MKNLIRTTFIIYLLITNTATFSNAQVKTLDDFETTQGWSFNKSDGVDMNMSLVQGVNGKAIRMDYDFTKGTGYGGIQKWFPVDLPENFEFTFYLKAESPANNFEIKLIDKSGDNVWWLSNRNYSFPQEWRKIRLKKRHISFAWGPTHDQSMKRIDRIEFTIASFVGGKGTVWIDDLRFEPLPPETGSYPLPAVTASSQIKRKPAGLVFDLSEQTFWQSKGKKNQVLEFDLKTRRELGGFQINWLKGYGASAFEVYLSEDRKNREKAYSVTNNGSNVSFIRLPEAEARHVRLNLLKSQSGKSFGINEIKILKISESLTPNDFLIYAAKNSAIGDYPEYFSEKASYWTVTGVNNDVKEALINEYGMVEVDKALFAVEPVLRIGETLYNWSNVKPVQFLGLPGHSGEFEFIPSVTWKCGDVEFVTSVTASGEANRNSMLDMKYSFKNHSPSPQAVDFYLLIRPFQVNPCYQFLNFPGGAGKISRIGEEQNGTVTVDNKTILFQKPYTSFGAGTFDDGNIMEMIRKKQFPVIKSATDNQGMAHGVVHYKIRLLPGESSEMQVAVPFHGTASIRDILSKGYDFKGFDFATTFWKARTGHVRFNLPPSANDLIRTYRAMLAYILVNRDKVGIQPGSRSYERSWIRDGALTSSALLKSGITEEVKDFITWYASYQYENGKVPCVVDFRGPDPVPENDSHGQLIYLIREYFNFTSDTAFLRSKNVNVLKAVDYIASLVAERSTDHYKYGDDSVRAHYGLVPESISHEGYSAKPMHSYWDNFFIMKGLKDAADIQKILGEEEAYARVSNIRDTFRDNLYNSLQLAMKVRKIDYIPGCVELGDFDATSTTIALTPCNEMKNLPKPQIFNTFEKYYEFFRNRRDGKIDWINYTPYENRLIGSFIMLDQPGRAHELVDFLMNDQRPKGWHHWAEVVWKDERIARFIGDMPHTWCGSDFINAFRSMFVYENEYDQSLVLAAALRQDWINAPGGMSVENLPTYYGEISYVVKKEAYSYIIKISGDLKLPANGMQIRNFNGARLPEKVMINGKEITGFTERMIPVGTCPAELVIQY